MPVNFIRTILVYFFVVGAFRLMGKRQIGELQSSELVVAILISELAAVPIQDSSSSLVVSFLAIAILLICEVFISLICQKFPAARNLFYGAPSVLIEKGKINQAEMKRQRLNIGNLMEQIRNQGVESIGDVEYLIVETNGQVSVIQKAAKSPVTAENLDINVTDKKMSYIIIDDGKIIEQNIKRLGFNEKWLKGKLKENKIRKAKDVFFMSVTADGEVFLYPKECEKQ